MRVAHHLLRAPYAAHRRATALRAGGGTSAHSRFGGLRSLFFRSSGAPAWKAHEQPPPRREPTPEPRADAASSVDRQDAKEQRAFERNAQMTRLLIGDELGDALQLPFDVSGRRSARFALRLLRLYTGLCESWLLGGALTRMHRFFLRALQLKQGEQLFPMTSSGCPMEPTQTSRSGHASGCPMKLA